jgi:trigger factor
MSTQIEHLENHTARLTVEVAPERVDKAMHDAARRIAKQVNIPGFRKGKAPYNVILQRIGEEALLEEALDQLGNEVFREALAETKIEPYAPGSLEHVESKPTLKLTFVVPKQPEVDLGAYRDIRMPFESPEVEDKAVTDAMKGLQERRALIETVTRPAQLGDLVKAHVSGERVHPADAVEPVEGEGENEGEAEPAESHTDQFVNEELTVLLSDNEEDEDIVPGFSANLVGASAGEQKTFSIAYPDDYKVEALARHTFNFTVDVKEVQSRTLPALNDEFAKQVSDNEIDNLLDLRIRVRKDLQEAATRDAESKFAEEVLDKVVEQATIKHPEAMVEEYIDDILENVDRNLRERGLSLKDYQRIESKDDAALRADYRETAIQRLKRALALGSIVSQEKLAASDDDIESQIDKLSAQFGEQAATFRNMLSRPDSKRNIALDLVTNRAFHRLIEIARGENPSIGLGATDQEAGTAEAPAEAAVAPAAPAATDEQTAEAPAAAEMPAETPASSADAPAETAQPDQTPPAE